MCKIYHNKSDFFFKKRKHIEHMQTGKCFLKSVTRASLVAQW